MAEDIGSYLAEYFLDSDMDPEHSLVNTDQSEAPISYHRYYYVRTAGYMDDYWRQR